MPRTRSERLTEALLERLRPHVVEFVETLPGAAESDEPEDGEEEAAYIAQRAEEQLARFRAKRPRASPPIPCARRRESHPIPGAIPCAAAPENGPHAPRETAGRKRRKATGSP